MLVITEKSITGGLTRSQLDYIKKLFANKGFRTINMTISLEHTGMGLVPCDLYGPLMLDDPIQESDIIYARRLNQPFSSRCVDMPVRMVTKVSIIAGPGENAEDGQCVLYAAYGGPLVPKEPDDPNMTLDELEYSKAFWATHALCAPEQSEEDVCDAGNA